MRRTFLLGALLLVTACGQPETGPAAGSAATRARLHGTVAGYAGARLPDRLEVVATRLDGDANEYTARVGRDGRFAVAAPAGRYSLGLRGAVVADPVAAEVTPRSRATDKPGVQLVAYTPVQAKLLAPRSVVEWIRASAIQIASARPRDDDRDLEPICQRLADARIVALGESTHGTSEFFTLKHRLVRALVSCLGVRALVMEANWAESVAVDEYIVNGRGSPEAALAGMHFWTWDVQEVLALLRDLRGLNQGLPATDRVRFFGIDMQYSSVAHRSLMEYLRRVDPKLLGTVRPALAPLANDSMEDYRALSAATQEGTRKALALVLATLASRQAAYRAHSSDVAWRRAKHTAVTLQQAERYYRAGDDRASVREAALATNLRWVVGTLESQRLVLWAHNWHVARTGSPRPLGARIADEIGDRYYAVGMTFLQGGFQARDRRLLSGARGALTDLHVGVAPVGSLEHTISRAGAPLLFVDLRHHPGSGEVLRWLSAEQTMRNIGAVFYGELPTYERVKPLETYDALMYVESTTRAHPTPTGHRAGD